MVISGELKPGDVPSDLVVQRRVLGRRASLSALVYGGCIVLAAYLPLLLGMVIGWPSEQQMPLLLGGAAAAIAVYVAAHSTELWRRKAFARELMGRGAAGLAQPVLISIDDRLHIESAHVRSDVDWALVLELFPSADSWVLLVGPRPYPVPKRFFADEQAELAFVRAVLAHLTDAARERSSEARELTLWS